MSDPKFEIAQAYPLLNQYYGLLVGPAHTIPTAVFSLVAGALSQYGNRKMMLCIVVATLSMFQLAYGLVDSFVLFMVLKTVS